MVPVEADPPAEPSPVDLPTLDSATTPGVSATACTSSTEERLPHPDPTEVRGRRRARGKSALVGCFIIADMVYLLFRFSAHMPFALTFIFKSRAIDESDGMLNDIFCGNLKLAILITWLQFWCWLIYFSAIVTLAISAVMLYLRLCYAFVALKLFNILVFFIGLMGYGYNCHYIGFYIEGGLFFILHLPLQMLGFKVVSKFIRSLKRTRSYHYTLSRTTSGVGMSSRIPSPARSTRTLRQYTTVDDLPGQA